MACSAVQPGQAQAQMSSCAGPGSQPSSKPALGLPRCCLPLQVGFVMRLVGGRLAAHLEEQLPDYAFAFEGGSEGAAGEVCGWVVAARCVQDQPWSCFPP